MKSKNPGVSTRVLVIGSWLQLFRRRPQHPGCFFMKSGSSRNQIYSHRVFLRLGDLDQLVHTVRNALVIVGQNCAFPIWERSPT